MFVYAAFLMDKIIIVKYSIAFGKIGEGINENLT